MPMTKRKLQSGKPKLIRKTAGEKMAQKRETKENRVEKRKYNKEYYRKNKTTILKRQAAARGRQAKGDTRTTRRTSAK